MHNHGNSECGRCERTILALERAASEFQKLDYEWSRKFEQVHTIRGALKALWIAIFRCFFGR